MIDAADIAWMEDLLTELVAASTEEAGQEVMTRAFADCGLTPVDVVATWEGGGGRSLILNGHVDVVPPASEALWSSPPFTARRVGDWVYGRGAGDMKAGLVAMTGAVRALRRAGVELIGDLQLQSVVEEECTGNGTLQCLLAGADADACVITEPHPDHFTIAQVGVLWFHVDVRGIPGHAARGARSAVDAFAHPINLNPGIVSAGDWVSTVPAECTLSCRLAMYPGQEPAELQRLVEEAVARAGPYPVRYDGFACEGSVVAEEADGGRAALRSPGGFPRSASARGPSGSTGSTSGCRCAR